MTTTAGNNKVEIVKFEEMTQDKIEVVAHRVFKTLKACRFNVPSYLQRFKPTEIEKKCFNKMYSWNTEITLELNEL